MSKIVDEDEVTRAGPEVDVIVPPEWREYVCIRWPELKIGQYIEFHRNRFRTDRPELQKVIEEHDHYGRYILPVKGDFVAKF